MDTIFATLACCLLTVSFSVAQTGRINLGLTSTPTTTTSVTTMIVTSSSISVHPSVTSASTGDKAPFTSTPRSNETFTKAITAKTDSTNQPETFQSTTTVTPLTNSTSLTSTTPGIPEPTSTVPTTPAILTTEGSTSTPDSTAVTTANSPATVGTSSGSMDSSTKGFGLNISERIMTIVLSVVLGVFALALATFMFHRCKHRLQYVHQPLNNDMDEFGADGDTLIISGGLYDGNPICDNVPTSPEDQSQFHLEFLH